MEVTSVAFTVDASGGYWVVAQALGDSPGGWARYDDMVLERRRVEGCPSVAGPDREICQGDTIQIGTGCLPSPHPLDSLEYCYRWMPETGLDDPENAMPHASPEQTVTYRVYVTASDGELVAEDEVTVTVNTHTTRHFSGHRVRREGTEPHRDLIINGKNSVYSVLTSVPLCVQNHFVQWCGQYR